MKNEKIENLKYNLITVVLLQFNSKLNDSLASLRSIVKQKNVVINIVIADDGSKDNHYKEITEYLSRYEVNYHFSLQKENVGTVINYLAATRYVNTDYVMSLGQGDILYDEYTLQNISKEIDNNDYCLIFGNLINYELINGKGKMVSIYSNPQILDSYIKNNKYKIKRNYLMFKDVIGGSTVLYNTKKLKEYLNLIKGKVIYTEDSIIRIMVYNEEKIKYINVNYIYYEYGNGISTNIDSPYRKQLTNDWREVTKIILDLCRKNNSNFDNRLIKFYSYRNKEHHNLFERICFNVFYFDYFMFKMRKKILPRMTIAKEENMFLYDNLKFGEDTNEDW